MPNSILTHWNHGLSRARGRQWLALGVFLLAFTSYLVPLIRRGELSLPPAAGGDEPDYDAIALQLVKGNGFAVDWDDADYRALYAQVAIDNIAAKPQASAGAPISGNGSQYAA